MRLIEWPRMPFLNDEVKEWIALELESLGVDDLAVYALEAGQEGDERRVMVATEIGLLDHRYAPFGSSARYRLAMLMYPWQVLRGVELRADTFRLWAREHRTRWSFRLHHPHFEAATESPDLGQALCDLARVCAVMAEPFGVPAGRVSSDVPGVIPGGPRPLPAAATSDGSRAAPVAAVAPMREHAAPGDDGSAPAEPDAAATDGVQQDDARPEADGEADDDGGGADQAAEGAEADEADEGAETEAAGPTPVAIGEDEEILELSDEERAAVPTRSDEAG